MCSACAASRPLQSIPATGRSGTAIRRGDGPSTRTNPLTWPACATSGPPSPTCVKGRYGSNGRGPGASRSAPAKASLSGWWSSAPRPSRACATASARCCLPAPGARRRYSKSCPASPAWRWAPVASGWRVLRPTGNASRPTRWRSGWRRAAARAYAASTWRDGAGPRAGAPARLRYPADGSIRRGARLLRRRGRLTTAARRDRAQRRDRKR